MKNISISAPPAQPRRKALDGGFVFLAMVTLSAALAVILLKGQQRALSILWETFGFLAELSPKIVAGTFVASTLPMVLPREKVSKWIGHDSGLRGLLLSVLAGACIPGGPMMIFPLATGFVVAGADLGAIIAFISSWNLLGLNRTLIWEFSFFDAHMVLIRWGFSFPLPLVLGLVTRFVVARHFKIGLIKVQAEAEPSE